MKKPYTGKPRGRKPKQGSLGSNAEVERIIAEATLEMKSENSPRRGRPPKIASRGTTQPKENSSDSEEELVEITKNEPHELDSNQETTTEKKSETKKRGRKPKSWHLENQRLIQQRQLERLNSSAPEAQPQENSIKDESEDDKAKEEMEYNVPQKMQSPLNTSTMLKDNQKRPLATMPTVKVPPPTTVFISPLIRKKAKKKSWIVSGYQSLESPVGHSETFDEEINHQEQSMEHLALPVVHNLTFIKKNCLPLYIITLPSSRSRYFLDIQLGLFLQFSSGRAFIDSIPGLLTRIAATAEKECLEQSAVSETIYSSMIYANESAARWIKTVSHAGHVGLKMTDLDIHFVKEDDVKSLLDSRIKALSEQLDGDQVNFFDEIFIGKKEEIGLARRNLGKSSPTGGYVHKLKRHANK